MPGPNKNYGQLNADAVGSETNPNQVFSDEINRVIVASETMSGYPGIHSALDDAASASTPVGVLIAGRGDQSTGGYQKAVDLSHVEIRTAAGTTWAHDGTSTNWLLYPESGAEDITVDLSIKNENERGVRLPADDEMSVTLESFGSPTDSTIRIGAGSGMATNVSVDVTLDGDGAFNPAIKLDCSTDSLEVDGQIRNFPESMLNTGFTHDALKVDIGIKNSHGVDLSGGALNWCDIRLRGKDVSQYLFKGSPYDGLVRGTAQCGAYGFWIIDGRDSKIEGSVEDGSEWGVRLQRTVDDEYTAVAKHTIDVQASNFDKDGCLLEGAVECTVRGQYNQNSDGNSGTYSGVRLASITVNSTTYTPDDNNINVQAHDNHGTKTQNYGVDIEAGVDNTVDGNLKYNLTGGLNDNGTTTTTATTLKQ